MGVLAILLIVSVPLSGGDLRRLGQLQLCSSWLLPVALGLQVLVVTIVPDAPHAFAVSTHLLSYVLAALFIWRNRHLKGLPLLALGAASNAVTILLNGGTLPASAAAVQRAGLTIPPGDFTNSGVLADPRLPWLGDVFAVPAWFPFANVFSIGDVLIIAGAARALHVATRRSCRPVATDPLLQLTPEQLHDELCRLRTALAEARARQRHLSCLLSEDTGAGGAVAPGRAA